jgi:MYXO-CTERM domain-containing protein
MVNKGSVEVKRFEAENKIEATVSQFRSRANDEIVGVLVRTPAEAVQPGGGGGGGCSVTPATPASGLFNLGVLFSGLLGLFGFRRRKH